MSGDGNKFSFDVAAAFATVKRVEAITHDFKEHKRPSSEKEKVLSAELHILNHVHDHKGSCNPRACPNLQEYVNEVRRLLYAVKNNNRY